MQYVHNEVDYFWTFHQITILVLVAVVVVITVLSYCSYK